MGANRVGAGCKVFAFEPNPRHFALLVRNIEANGYSNVIPVKKAVSNKIGTANLFLDPENKASNKIYNPHNGSESITIDVTSLDEFFLGKEYPIEIIKMDIEGAEMAALQGMAKIIEKNDDLKIVTEFFPSALQKFGFSPVQFLNKLISYGFRLYIIKEEEGTGECVEFTDPNYALEICKSKKSINLFCEKA